MYPCIQVVATLLYASSAWWGFTSSYERELMAAFIHRGVRRGFCPPDLPTIDELVSHIDGKLFDCITSDEHHILHQLLPPERPDYGHTPDHKNTNSALHPNPG